MRIGTWNLAGRWGPEHVRFVAGLDCDVLLLTEVDDGVELPDHHLHVSRAAMVDGRHWAGVATRAPSRALRDPHPASAAVECGGLVWCSSTLPWTGAAGAPWVGASHREHTEVTLNSLTRSLPRTDLVWGGAWNHSLLGEEQAGSKAGRRYLMHALDILGLRVPTTHLAHVLPSVLSTDHIGIPTAADVRAVEAVTAAVDDQRLTDRDAYVVTLA